MAGRFSIETVFKGVDRMTAPVKRMQNSVGKFTRGMERGFRNMDRRMSRFASGMKKVAAVTAAGMAAAGAAAFNVLGAGADFEQAITNVGAVSLKTRDQLKDLEDQALQLGRTTKFTSTQAANAMEVLARAGFNNAQILKTVPAVLSAAAASGLEIADVANHVSNVLKGMGLAASESARVADVLALASARTNSTIGSLGESMKNVSSTARQLNVPLEDTVAAVALLQDVGLDASVAGSAFNVMLTKMAAPSAKIDKIMRRLGISFKDSNGNMKALPAVLADISKASKQMGGNFDQVAFLAELVGLRGQKAAANLSKLFDSGKLEVLTAELNNATGSAERMAKIRMDTVQGSLLLLGSAVDAVKVKIFSMNDGALKKLIDRMTAWVSANEDLIATKVGDFIASVVENIGPIVEWLKRIGKGIAVFFVLSTVIKTLIGVMMLLNLAMALNPIGLIVLGVTALIAAFTALIVWTDDVVEAFDRMPLALRFVLTPLELIVRSIKFIKDNFDSIVGAASGVAGFFGDGLLNGGDDDSDDAGAAPSRSALRAESVQSRRQAAEERILSGGKSEVTIRDETGRAETTSGRLPRGISLQPSGTF